MLYRLIFSAVALTYFFRWPFIKYLQRSNLVEKNYQDKEIPIGYGLLVGVVFLIILKLGLWVKIYEQRIAFFLYFLLVTSLIAGVIDDFYEQRNENGFYGHFSTFFKESKVTSGFLKAFLIAFAAVIISFELNDSYSMFLIDFFLIVFSANFINLLDLRPGRAVKFFLLATILNLLLFPEILKYVLPLIAILLILLPLDLKGEIMLGDTGANFLGSLLGFMFVIILSVNYKIWLLLFLIIIHFYTERYSLTEYIKKNKVLNYIDLIGR